MVKKIVVSFKSNSANFFKERDGLKPNTIRQDDRSDPRFKLLSKGTPTHITIKNAGNQKWKFTRRITDITFYMGWWVISWKHEAK